MKLKRQLKRHDQKEMFAHIEQWENSGQMKAKYCRERGVSRDAFYYWYKKYLKEIKSRSTANPQTTNFVPIAVDQNINPLNTKSDMPLFEICYSNGTLVRIYQPIDSHLLTTLLQQ
jgi:uncharacterized protein YdiU (UPF0061 family)